VFIVVGDGSYLMLPGELVTAVAERIGVVIVLIDNHGYASIGALSRSVGSAGYGTHYRWNLNGSLPVDAGADGSWSDGGADALPVDLAANAASLGARARRVSDISELREALRDARAPDGPVVIVIDTDRYRGVPSYDAWWDVPVAEVSDEPAVDAARATYEHDRRLQRHYVEPPRGE
jgi:3D-(3,5/4)-trihydroxycyclohexane-1,2-dione acylhydrolase (decyclizing)